MNTVIALDDADIRIAEVLATELAKKFSSDSGPYGANGFERHNVGKRGELAAERWARSLPRFFIPFFRDINNGLNEPDLKILSSTDAMVRVEVKTWREHNWIEYGRCIVGEQGDRLVAKTDAVLWCVVLETTEGWASGEMTPNVQLKGWSMLDDIEQSPEVEMGPNKIRNRQVSLEKMRQLDSLVAHFGL